MTPEGTYTARPLVQPVPVPGRFGGLVFGQPEKLPPDTEPVTGPNLCDALSVQ